MANVSAVGLDTRAYRDAVGQFATGVTLCTTVTESGHHGITANSFTSVSLDPLLVLISVEKIARFHDEVLSSGLFAISVLGSRHESAAAHFAVRGRPETEDQFSGVPHQLGPSTGCIVVSDARAVLECRVWSQADGGDHTLILGEVLAFDLPTPAQPALLYVEGGFRSLQ